MAWDVVIVGEAGNEAGALESVAEHEPDVVLLDLRLQGESGLDICRRLGERHAGIKVGFLTVYEDEQYVVRGAAGGGATC
jgi:DNA-binding NarL/FixJ family response regulator